MHDHPWWFWTFVIKGSYVDQGSIAQDWVRTGQWRYRRAEHQHTVIPDPGGAWTLLITGPKIRDWGFWKFPGKFIKANKWFATYGHHPCSGLAATPERQKA